MKIEIHDKSIVQLLQTFDSNISKKRNKTSFIKLLTSSKNITKKIKQMIPTISITKQSQIKSNQTISTKHLDNNDQPITISQIIKRLPVKASQMLKKTDTIYKHQGLRQSEQDKYVVEVFSYLNLETKKSIQPKSVNNGINGNINTTSNRYSIPNPTNNKYLMQMPQTCKSLVKIQQPTQQQQQLQTPTLKGTTRRANQSNPHVQFNIDNSQQVIESQFHQQHSDNNNNNNNTTNINQRQKPAQQIKNKRVVKNQFNFESIQDAPQGFYQPNHSTFNNNNHGQSHMTSNVKGKRSSKQIRTFNIQNIQQKKQSDFGGCCGFGIVDKIAFFSKDG